MRTTAQSVTFAFPFTLGVPAEEHPAGTYEVETDESVFAGVDRTTYLRVRTVMLVTTAGTTRHREVNPTDFAAALAADGARADALRDRSENPDLGRAEA